MLVSMPHSSFIESNHSAIILLSTLQVTFEQCEFELHESTCTGTFQFKSPFVQGLNDSWESAYCRGLTQLHVDFLLRGQSVPLTTRALHCSGVSGILK